MRQGISSINNNTQYSIKYKGIYFGTTKHIDIANTLLTYIHHLDQLDYNTHTRIGILNRSPSQPRPHTQTKPNPTQLDQAIEHADQENTRLRSPTSYINLKRGVFHHQKMKRLAHLLQDVWEYAYDTGSLDQATILSQKDLSQI